MILERLYVLQSIQIHEARRRRDTSHSESIHAEQFTLPAYRPSLLFRSGHIQTIWQTKYRVATPHLDFQAIQAPLQTSGSTYCYISRTELSRTDLPAILLIHGLAGTGTSRYLIRIAERCLRLGFRVVRMDLPGCGNSASLSSYPPHAGCSREVFAALKHLHSQLGWERWIVGGFSLGGNVAINLGLDLQGAESSPIELAGLIAVAPPIDLSHCSWSIERGVNRFYAKFFLKELVRQRDSKAKHWESWRPFENQPSPPSIGKFDDLYTAPLSGFRDAKDYYRQASTHQRLHELQIPTEVLVDRHDPIVPFQIFRNVQWTESTNVQISRFGGHLGYLHYPNGLPACWMDDWFAHAAVRLAQPVRQTRIAPSASSIGTSPCLGNSRE